MSERILYREWRREHETTKYPFSEAAALVNSEGTAILEGMFLDAVFHVIGAKAGLFLSQVSITHTTITLWVGDASFNQQASASFPLITPPADLKFKDLFGRPAGMIVSEPQRLAIMRSWGIGDHFFTRAESELVATVCIPTPEPGVRGFILDDGSVLTGDVWLVGDDGVVVRPEPVSVPGVCGGPPVSVQAVRVDVVGDPLFRRRLCGQTALFTTPNPVRKVKFVGGGRSFVCTPDARGNIRIAANNNAALDTVLRITPTVGGVTIGNEGSVQNG